MVHEPSDFAGISRHARYELMPSFDGAVSVITWLPLAQGRISKSQSQCRMQMHRIHILVGCTVFLPQQLFGHTRLDPLLAQSALTKSSSSKEAILCFLRSIKQITLTNRNHPICTHVVIASAFRAIDTKNTQAQ